MGEEKPKEGNPLFRVSREGECHRERAGKGVAEFSGKAREEVQRPEGGKGVSQWPQKGLTVQWGTDGCVSNCIQMGGWGCRTGN